MKGGLGTTVGCGDYNSTLWDKCVLFSSPDVWTVQIEYAKEKTTMSKTTNKVAKFDAKQILSKPEVKIFNDQVAKCENAGRLAQVTVANLIYAADTDGTTKAMGLESAADFLIQVRGYSRSQAYNLQRVGRFLKGTTEKDLGGNVYSVSALLELLTAFNNDYDAVHKFIGEGKTDAFTSVRKLRAALKAATTPKIAADAESKDVTEGKAESESKAESDSKTDSDSDSKTDSKPYIVDMAIIVPNGVGGEVTYKSINGKYTLPAIVAPLQKLAAINKHPEGKIVVTIKAVK